MCLKNQLSFLENVYMYIKYHTSNFQPQFGTWFEHPVLFLHLRTDGNNNQANKFGGDPE